MRIITKSLLAAVVITIFASAAFGQVDDICREFGVIPSLDNPRAQIPYVYGKVTLAGFDPLSLPKVTVVFSDRDNPATRVGLSKSGSYCFRRNASAGYLAIEVNGVEVVRRSLPSFGAAQQREDFDIYPTGAAPGAPSTKLAYPRNEKTVELYKKAAEAEKIRDIPAAIGFVKEIVAIDAQDFIAWSILGSLYLEQKSYGEADAALRKSLALKVEYTPAWINVGRLRVAQKQMEAAIEIFKHAATLEPTSARIYKLLGETYLQSKQGTLGVEALNQAIKLDPIGMAECHLLLGRLYELAGAKKEAAREYKMFLEKVRDYVDKAKLEKFIKENSE